MIVKRLLKVSSDYEQVKASRLEHSVRISA